MSAAGSVASFRKKVSKNAGEVFRQVCLEMSTRILRRSPVDSGRFKGNWFASINSANIATNGGLDPSGAGAISAAKAITLQLKNSQTFYFTNNLPYAYRLEYEGWSKQAPMGMVRLTVAEFKTIVNASTMAVRNGN